MEVGRVYVSVALFLLAITLIFHLVAMGYPRWKIFENRDRETDNVFIGLFHRCEHRPFNNIAIINKTYFVCDDNKYLPNSKRAEQTATLPSQSREVQLGCNRPNNTYGCDYLSTTKGLISLTIIAACTLGLSLLLIYSHLLINQFKYKTHLGISLVTICLLIIGFLSILITLIILGSTMSTDLLEYRYDFSYRLSQQGQDRNTLETSLRNQSATEYHTRLDWSAGLEIIALILSSFVLAIQILYLFRTYRSRIG